MKLSLLILLILLHFSLTRTISRLDTAENSVIVAGDNIISTLGIFQMSLQPDCTFEVSQYNQTVNQYFAIGTLALPLSGSPQNSPNCTLEISA